MFLITDCPLSAASLFPSPDISCVLLFPCACCYVLYRVCIVTALMPHCLGRPNSHMGPGSSCTREAHTLVFRHGWFLHTVSPRGRQKRRAHGQPGSRGRPPLVTVQGAESRQQAGLAAACARPFLTAAAVNARETQAAPRADSQISCII